VVPKTLAIIVVSNSVGNFKAYATVRRPFY
jgi:hypothetical protein